MKHSDDFEHIRQYDLFVWAEAYKRELENESKFVDKYVECLRNLGKRPSILNYRNDLSSYLWEVKLYDIRLEEIEREFEFAPIKNAAEKVRVGTIESWSKIRKFVWKRDNGICQICNRKIDFSEYDCGHIVDRVCGGSDRPENLVVMCRVANMSHKPLTETKAKYMEWVNEYQSCDKYYENQVREYLAQLPKDVIDRYKEAYYGNHAA